MAQSGVWWTHDGGAHWLRVTPQDDLPAPATFVTDVVSAQTAWVAANGSHHSAIFRTTNHGLTWTRVTPAPQASGGTAVNSLDFLSAHTGFLAADEGSIMNQDVTMVIDQTTDRGRTWTMLPSSITPQMVTPGSPTPRPAHGLPLGGPVTGMSWVSARRGWVTGLTGNQGGWVGQTQNGGKTWNTVKLPVPPGQHVYNVSPPQFFGEQTGIIMVQTANEPQSGEFNADGWVVETTTNRGHTWHASAMLSGGYGTQAVWSFANGQNGIVGVQTLNSAETGVARARWYRTADGGHHWSSLKTNAPLQTTAVDRVTSRIGYAVVRHGRKRIGPAHYGPAYQLWKTTDGGRHWQAVSITVQSAR